MRRSASRILVLGIADVASAVAHRLFTDGWDVALHQGPEPPLAHRRAMSFADAWFDGTAMLEGVRATRLQDIGQLEALLLEHTMVPVLPHSIAVVLAAATWTALIDARMRKRDVPVDARGFAPLVIGLGPGFVAGGNVDLAVETGWGPHLGAVIGAGATARLAGEPRPIREVGRERIVYAARAGILRVRAGIGASVVRGEAIVELDGQPIESPLTGTVRGAVRDGVFVPRHTKIAEIDPRPPSEADFSGIGERPRRIAEGVAVALMQWTSDAAAGESEPPTRRRRSFAAFLPS